MSKVLDVDEFDYAGHLETCDLGDRYCRDCSFSRDEAAKSLLSIARQEVDDLEFWLKTETDSCVYCGAESEHRDHLLPLPWTGPETRKLVPVVPSCADCNVRLGSVVEPRVPERAALVAAALRKKWARKLRIPDRTEEDLAEYGERMRVNLVAAQTQRQEIRRRLMILDQGGAPFAVGWGAQLKQENRDLFALKSSAERSHKATGLFPVDLGCVDESPTRWYTQVGISPSR